MIECIDTNNDGCTEEVAKTCDVVCDSDACTTERQNFMLNVGDIIYAFSERIKLATIDSNDKTATLYVGEGEDMETMGQGVKRTTNGLEITVNTIGTNSISIHVVPASG